jgi:tetratricopeptide (TPR) repeat protein
MRIAASILFLFLTWVSARGAVLVSLEIEFREAWQDQPESSMVADFEKVTLVLGKDNHIFLGNASLALQPILTDLYTLQIRADIFGLPPKIKTSFKQVQLKKNQSSEVAQVPGKPGRLYRILFKNWQILDRKIDCEENPFDTLLWAADFSTHFNFHYLKNSLADYYWNHSKEYLESEFGRIRKFYDVYPVTKLEFYYHNCLYPQANWNKELGTALFPAQKEIRVLFGPHDKLLDSPHLQILMLLNQWGYAPLFLTYGMSGFFTLNHYYTKKYLEQKKFIPLDSLFNSASYRRQDQKAAYFESASFIRFLIEKTSPGKMVAFYREVSDINVKELLNDYFGDREALQQEWLKYVKEYSPLADDLSHFARLYTGLRNYPEALELYLEMEQSYPEHQTTDHLANVYYILGNYPEALKFYQKWVKQDTLDADRHYVLGNMYWLKGELSLARQEFEKSIALDSNSVMAYLNLAKLALDSAQYERCQSYLEKSESRKAGQQEQLEYHLLRADLHRALVQQVLADSTALRAQLLAKQILRNNQEEGFAYLLMGRAYLASDSLDQAEKYLKVAQLLEDRAFYVGQTYLLLAELYLRKGDKSIAKEYLQAVLNSPSGFREQSMARKLLAQL